ncbi:MAG: hypothetical protein GPOALKHO_000478 [Sodalis sp.]|nr:MAG: hypothetical protein GPOALKHO_000478 [Sodalis sp.]
MALIYASLSPQVDGIRHERILDHIHADERYRQSGDSQNWTPRLRLALYFMALGSLMLLFSVTVAPASWQTH